MQFLCIMKDFHGVLLLIIMISRMIGRALIQPLFIVVKTIAN